MSNFSSQNNTWCNARFRFIKRAQLRQGYFQSNITKEMPKAIASWLFDTDSLTERLVSVGEGSFHVKVFGQYFRRAFRDECKQLAIDDRRVCFIRQVHLFCKDKPCMFARTVIPVSTLTGERKQLKNLGKKPLGALLFSNCRVERVSMQVAKIDSSSRYYRDAVNLVRAINDPIWGRRSVFEFSGKSLLVSELFLPPLIELSG